MASRGINNNKEIPNCTRKRVYGSTHIAVNAKQRRGSSVRSCHLEGLLQNLPWIYGVHAVVLWASNTFRLCPTTRVASNGTLSRPGALTFGATNMAWLWLKDTRRQVTACMHWARPMSPCRPPLHLSMRWGFLPQLQVCTCICFPLMQWRGVSTSHEVQYLFTSIQHSEGVDVICPQILVTYQVTRGFRDKHGSLTCEGGSPGQHNFCPALPEFETPASGHGCDLTTLLG